MPVRLNGSTSGYVELAAPAIAGATSLELPTDSIKPGLVLVAAQSFSAVSSVSVNNCFTATYDNYRIVANLTASTSASITTRLRLSGTDASGSNYAYRQVYWAGSVAVYSGTSTAWGLTASPATGIDIGFDLYGPAKSTPTRSVISGAMVGVGGGDVNATEHNLSTAYDGITVLTSTGTMTGSLQVFGYRKTV